MNMKKKLENDKRQIYVLKKEYLSMLFNDLEDIMPYKKGSGGYVSRSQRRAITLVCTTNTYLKNKLKYAAMTKRVKQN